MEVAAEEEGKVIVDTHAIHGINWSLILRLLKGRPKRDVKDRFDILMSIERTPATQVLDVAKAFPQKKKLSPEEGKLKQTALQMKQKEAKLIKAIEAKAMYEASERTNALVDKAAMEVDARELSEDDYRSKVVAGDNVITEFDFDSVADGLKSSDDGTSSMGNASASQGATWVSLLGSPSSKKGITKLYFTPFETINGVSMVSFTVEEFIESIKEFDAHLVGNFVGKRLDYIFQVFIIRPWRPFIETEESELKTIPIWVNLNKVPSHLWTPHGIEKIASFIGTPLFLDKVTEDRTRTSFARVCVEADIDKDLPSIIPISYEGIRKSNVEVEYNWISTKCSEYKVFGHSILNCPKNLSIVKNVSIVSFRSRLKHMTYVDSYLNLS
ncbi:hypothetical protein GIB67_012819 [Kingdonia uniflora]|uniref:DUF4283 domain-containing protein n=1 Tax=Kingdonia uniflora TaxID=39325 RepID=A0A7J7NG14_9MAGN|nr:hypothetical protein GIB67_012819 [Kingdonia uniflora]